MLFQAFGQKIKIVGSTAARAAQFRVIQFPLQTFSGFQLEGLKICMHARNAMLHVRKL